MDIITTTLLNHWSPVPKNQNQVKQSPVMMLRDTNIQVKYPFGDPY